MLGGYSPHRLDPGGGMRAEMRQCSNAQTKAPKKDERPVENGPFAKDEVRLGELLHADA
jgi:hypothetical protein